MFEMIKVSSKFFLLTLMMGGLMSSMARAQTTNKASSKVKPASQHSTSGDNSAKRLDSDSASGQIRSDQPERPERADKAGETDA